MNVVVTEVINIALMSVLGQHHQRSFGDHLPGSEMTIPVQTHQNNRSCKRKNRATHIVRDFIYLPFEELPLTMVL